MCGCVSKCCVFVFFYVVQFTQTWRSSACVVLLQLSMGFIPAASSRSETRRRRRQRRPQSPPQPLTRHPRRREHIVGGGGRCHRLSTPRGGGHAEHEYECRVEHVARQRCEQQFGVGDECQRCRAWARQGGELCGCTCCCSSCQYGTHGRRTFENLDALAGAVSHCWLSFILVLYA